MKVSRKILLSTAVLMALATPGGSLSGGEESYPPIAFRPDKQSHIVSLTTQPSGTPTTPPPPQSARSPASPTLDIPPDPRTKPSESPASSVTWHREGDKTSLLRVLISGEPGTSAIVWARLHPNSPYVFLSMGLVSQEIEPGRLEFSFMISADVTRFLEGQKLEVLVVTSGDRHGFGG